MRALAAPLYPYPSFRFLSSTLCIGAAATCLQGAIQTGSDGRGVAETRDGRSAPGTLDANLDARGPDVFKKGAKRFHADKALNRGSACTCGFSRPQVAKLAVPRWVIGIDDGALGLQSLLKALSRLLGKQVRAGCRGKRSVSSYMWTLHERTNRPRETW